MRSMFLALVIAMAAPAIPVMARDYPYCIKGCDFGGGRGDCSFSSYQQCQASAAGRDAYCAENPNFNARADITAEIQGDRSRLSRRRF
jgi:uncharacterized protein DUF3551